MHKEEIIQNCHFTLTEKTLVEQYLHDLEIRKTPLPPITWTKDRIQNKIRLLSLIQSLRWPELTTYKQKMAELIRQLKLPPGSKVIYDPYFETKTVQLDPPQEQIERSKEWQALLDFIKNI